jgi:hypothetical protein
VKRSLEMLGFTIRVSLRSAEWFVESTPIPEEAKLQLAEMKSVTEPSNQQSRARLQGEEDTDTHC